MKVVSLTVVAGVLLGLALPPYDVEWLGWLAVAPLLAAARGRRFVEALGLGLLTGVVCGVVHVGWYPEAHGLHSAYLPYLWLAMVLGVVTALSSVVEATGLRWVAGVASAGVAVEWLTTFSPLPVNLALCQYRTPTVLQIASLTGIWGVSFLLWWTNAALADALERRPFLTRPLGWTVMALGCIWLFGAVTLLEGDFGPRVRVAAIQDTSSGETASFVRPVSLSAEEPDREALTRAAVARGARLVVWSEECLGGAFSPDSRTDPTVALARELKTHLVVGYSEAAKPQPFNVAAIVAPDGSVKGEHRKIHLYMGERQSVQGGRATRAFTTDVGRVGVEICFDSCYTDVTRHIVEDGARLIAMPNYDPPTPRGVLHRLHAAMLPFRAVENRVAFVRADSNGCSQIIDPMGQIGGQSPLYAADALVGDVALGDGRGTIFTRLGDWLAYACMLLTLGFGLSTRCLPASVRTSP